MELFTYICIKMKVMEAKAKFDVVLSPEASDFLNGLGSKIRDKIVYNIRKSTYIIDPKLFKNWMIRIFGNLEQDTVILNIACWHFGTKRAIWIL